MDAKEREKLFALNARLNSPEAIAFQKQLAELQRRCNEAIKASGFTDLDDLAKAQAEAEAELRLFHKMQTERQLAESVEASPAPHYNLKEADEPQPAEPAEINPDPHYTLKLLAETAEMVNELKNIAQNMSKYHSEYHENYRTDTAKAEKEKKRDFRKQLFVAAFTVTLTLFFEHVHDIVKLILEFFSSLF